MRRLSALCVLFLLAVTLDIHAKEIGGIAIPEQVTLADGAEAQLSGAGIRKKFFVKVYVGALYLRTPIHDAKGILADPGAKRMLMHFIYKEVSREKLTDGWNKGFKKNNSAEKFAALKSRLDKFNHLMQDAKSDDVIWLDFLPGQGTQIWFNKQLKGTIEGSDFHQALLKVWVGEKPADGGLKKALLSGD